MATVYPEARNLCAAVTYTRSPTRSRNCCLERAGGGVAEVAASPKTGDGTHVRYERLRARSLYPRAPYFTCV